MNVLEATEIAFKITLPFGQASSPVRFIINKDITTNDSVPENYYFVDGKYYSEERVCYLEAPEKFYKGIYYLFVEVDNVATDLALTLLSSSLVQAKTVNNSDFPDFLEDIITCYMVLKESQYRCSKEEPEIQIKYYNGMKLAGYLAHYYTNDSPNCTTYKENFRYADMDALEFLFPFDKEQENVSVNVPPGNKVLKIMKKIDITAKADVSYNNCFVGSDEFLEKSCKEKGKKKAVKKGGDEQSNCIISILQHDAGYVFHFENKEEVQYLDAYIGFSSLPNVEPEDTFVSSKTGDRCWNFILKPGEERFFHIRRKDFKFKFGLTHKSSYKLIDPDENPRDFT